MELCPARIAALLPEKTIFREHISVADCVDSTNTRLAAMAAAGAAEGSVLLAEEQSGGRGTQGRAFYSPRGEGLYLSVLLRPALPFSALAQLTGWAAVALRRGIACACGAQTDIKWLNDLYLNGKKLCGILAEISFPTPGGLPCVVLGAGVNVTQPAEDFLAQGLGNIATSLAAEGFCADRERLCAAILTELSHMYRRFPAGREEYLAEYRAHCLTPGRAVSFREEGQTLRGTALEICDDFGLTVLGQDGRERRVYAGAVSHL